MGTLQLLPDAVLRKQVCHECSQFLSVPPIMISDSGETLCGRCFNGFEETELEHSLFTKSAFNIIGERFLFKCINHLNGCKEVLKFSETQKHEETCTYMSQECFFCSFSGNLSQILNHCLKLHPDNVTFDGRFFFSLNDKPYKKQMILVLNDNMYHIIFTVEDDSFTISIISPVTKCFPGKIDQYGVRFFKPEDPENVDYIHIDYGLLNDGMETFFEKSKSGLVNNFGPGSKLCCEVLVQKFTLEEKELQIKHKLDKLRQSEKDMNKYKQGLQDWEKKLSQQNENYQAAMNVIKKMSSDFFKCHWCRKIILDEIYFCLKNHCVCKGCLCDICKTCNSVQAFKKLKDIEKVMLSCDWAGCNEIYAFKDYMKHRSECLQRSYKCPLVDCNEVILSSQNLVEHWHCPIPELLRDTKVIIFDKYIQKEFYWLIEHDLYHVLIKFNNLIIQIVIRNVNVLKTNETSFKCFGYDDSNWRPLVSTIFCGNFQIFVKNTTQTANGQITNKSKTKLEITCQ